MKKMIAIIGAYKQDLTESENITRTHALCVDLRKVFDVLKMRPALNSHKNLATWKNKEGTPFSETVLQVYTSRFEPYEEFAELMKEFSAANEQNVCITQRDKRCSACMHNITTGVTIKLSSKKSVDELIIEFIKAKYDKQQPVDIKINDYGVIDENGDKE